MIRRCRNAGFALCEGFVANSQDWEGPGPSREARYTTSGRKQTRSMPQKETCADLSVCPDRTFNPGDNRAISRRVFKKVCPECGASFDTILTVPGLTQGEGGSRSFFRGRLRPGIQGGVPYVIVRVDSFQCADAVCPGGIRNQHRHRDSGPRPHRRSPAALDRARGRDARARRSRGDRAGLRARHAGRRLAAQRLRPRAGRRGDIPADAGQRACVAGGTGHRRLRLRRALPARHLGAGTSCAGSSAALP